MQIILNGGSTGTVDVTSVAVVYPITTPVFAFGVVDAGGLVEVDAGMSATLSARLMYWTFATDDSQSAGAWTAIGTAVVGPGKVFKGGAVSATGLRIQLGLELSDASVNQPGRARLRYPILVTK
jgi:hypothetical protein